MGTVLYCCYSINHKAVAQNHSCFSLKQTRTGWGLRSYSTCDKWFTGWFTSHISLGLPLPEFYFSKAVIDWLLSFIQPLLHQQWLLFGLEKVNNKLKPCTQGYGKPLFQDVFRSHHWVFLETICKYGTHEGQRNGAYPICCSWSHCSPSIVCYIAKCTSEDLQMNEIEINIWTQ